MSQTTPGPVVRVTVWGENLHEKRDESVQKLYPDGMHTTIASGIGEHLGERAVVAGGDSRPARARFERGILAND